MKYEKFKALINSICPDNIGVADVWQTWARELEEMDNPDHEIGDFKTEEIFLNEFADLIQEVKVKYGISVAQQVVQMASVPACPFPWEVKGAAEHFAKGGTMDDIPKMEEEGTLEDVSEYIEWVKNRKKSISKKLPWVDRDDRTR